MSTTRFLLVNTYDLPQEGNKPTGFNPKEYFNGLTMKRKKEVATYDFSTKELIEWLEEPSNNKDEYFFFTYKTRTELDDVYNGKDFEWK